MTDTRSGIFHVRFIPLAFISLHVVLLAFSASRHNPTIDESAHLAAGLSHWSFGHFKRYHVNPPLVRMCAVLPVLAAGYDEPGNTVAEFNRPEFDLGASFVASNGPRSVWLFTLARWALIPFSILGAMVCARWARELYGPISGHLALCLWCFSPNILGYGQLILPDVAATALGVTAWYCFWHWLKAPTWQGAFMASIAMGVAELTKFTWVILFALWPFVWIMYRLAAAKGACAAQLRRDALQLVAMGCGVIGVINVGYGFERPFQRLDQFTLRSRALTRRSDHENTPSYPNRFAGTPWGSIRVPFPENYVLGIDTQRIDFEHRLWSYCRGDWQRGGWWHYYLYALAIKVPLGSWCLLGIACGITIKDRSGLSQWRDEAVLMLPSISIIVFVSSQTGFSHHMRYVLPAFGFAMIFASKVARNWSVAGWSSWNLTIALPIWAVLSALSVFPHQLGYYNELIGGPQNGHAHLLNSNTDWGQDTLFLQRWLRANQGVTLAGFADDQLYRRTFDPALIGIVAPLPPVDPRWNGIDPTAMADAGPRPGWYAVEVSMLHNRKLVAEYFNEYEPTAYAGYSIHIYHISLSEANRVRRKLGLVELVDAGTDHENDGDY